MTIAGGFTLINLDPEGIEKLGAGLFTLTTTSGSPDTTVEDQVLADGDVVDKGINNLVCTNAVGVNLKAAAVPTLTSVTGSVDGVLTEVANDFEIVVDANSPSGYSIVFNVARGANLTTVAQDFTIDYASVTPIASQTISAGASTKTLLAYAMKITHTDDAGKIRQLELFAVDSNSGGFQFNFKGANEDGVEEMPITFTAKLDLTRTSGSQLMQWTVQTGAE
jgi:hypothetical protein